MLLVYTEPCRVIPPCSEVKMFRGINGGGRRTCLSMDKALLDVEWRFVSDSDEPGFYTAWMRQQSLRRQADSREREYRKRVLAAFADDFGMSLPSHVDEGEEDCLEGDDDVNEEREDIVRSMKNTTVSSRRADGSSIHHDRPMSPEVSSSVRLTIDYLGKLPVRRAKVGDALCPRE